jgi:hypothetical protein
MDRINNRICSQKLLLSIGGVEDAYLTEAGVLDFASLRTDKQKDVVKYAGYAAAGFAVLAGAALAYGKVRSSQTQTAHA